jgi:heavy metal efflux system protein
MSMTPLNRLIDASFRHRAVVLAATLAFAVAGLWAFATLNRDAFPDLTPNQVVVMTEMAGLSPVEVEQQVSYPMEVAMLGLPRTTDVRSISKAGLSVVTVTFEDDVDLYFARTQVQQRMQDAMAQLPAGAEAMLGPPSTAMGEAFQYLVESTTPKTGDAARDSLSLIALTNAQEYIVRPLLRTVPGVADVNAWGGLEQAYTVDADPTKLTGYGLTLDDVEQALAKNNANFGGGYVEDRGERLTLRGLGRAADTTDIGNVVVSTRDATPVYVRDVARVSIGAAPRFGAVTRDGRGEALSAVVLLLKGENSREVLQRVRARLDEIRPLLPSGITIRPFYDQSEVVERTSRTVLINLAEGALLVVATLVLFLGLRHARAALLTASVLPLSLLAAFLAMKRFGVTANLMSLGAVDFGLLADASVVLVEAMLFRLATEPAASPERRETLLREAAFEVGRPVLFGAAVIIAVLVPLFGLEHGTIEYKMFTPMVATLTAALIGSLLFALTYVPAVASYVLTRESASSAASGHDETRWFAAFRDRYVRSLDWALAHRRPVFAAAAAVLIMTVFSLRFLGSAFVPDLDEGAILLETRRAPSASLAQGIAVSEEVERTLRSFPEVASVVTNLGRPHEATETMALNQGDVYVRLAPKSQWRASSLDELTESMESALNEIPGLTVEVSAPMRMRLAEVISGVRSDLGVKVFGDSLPLLQEKAEEIQRVIARLPEAENATVGVSAGAMQLEIDLDRPAIARYGLNVADVREAIETGIGGSTATEVVDGRRRIPVVVRLASAYRTTPEAVGQTLIRTPAGGTVTLSQVARIQTVEGPEVVNHENGQRYVLVQSGVRGSDLGGFAAQVQRAIRSEVQLPPGYYVEYGGQFENQQRAMRRLGLIVPAVLLLIAGLLYANFRTVRHTLLVLLAVPFGMVGGIAMLHLTRLPLTLTAAIGLIAVAGIATLNGVVMITYMTQRLAAGRSLIEAVREGASGRLRAVCSTAAIAIVGYLPVLLSRSAGAEIQRPLAAVVVGGIFTAGLLSLLLLPLLFAQIEAAAERRTAGREVAGGAGSTGTVDVPASATTAVVRGPST